MDEEPVSDSLEDIESFLGEFEEVQSNGHTDFTDGTFEEVTFEEVDLDAPIAEGPAKPFEGDTTPVGDGECIVCGAPTFRPPGLTATGRKKRTPRHCDVHAPKLRVQKKGPGSQRLEPEPIGDSQLQLIQDELADDVRLLGTLAGPLLPVTGMYVYEAADPFTTAIVKLAKGNKTALRILHRAAQVAPIYTVAETLAGTAYAIQVDTQGANAHSSMAHRLKVDRAYDMVYPEEGGDNGTNRTQQPTAFSQPPRYSTVP